MQSIDADEALIFAFSRFRVEIIAVEVHSKLARCSLNSLITPILLLRNDNCNSDYSNRVYHTADYKPLRW